MTWARQAIGKAIALTLTNSGFDVAVVDVDVDAGTDLPNVAGQIRSLGYKSAAIRADISDLAAHEGMLEGAVAALGALTTLVNNSGVSVLSRGDLLDVSPEILARCMDVNARGTFFLTQAFARHLCRLTASGRSSSSITITSTNATEPSVYRGEYCIPKSAAFIMSSLFAARISDESICVYQIQPGFIETDMTAPSRINYDTLIENGLTVIKRFGTPDEVGRVAVTMASGLLPYTVGQPIFVDGGLLTVSY